MKLFLDYSNLNIVYRPKSDSQDRVVVDQGVLVSPLDPQLEGRLTVEGSELTMKQVQPADVGVFRMTDLAGFPVAHVYINVERKNHAVFIYLLQHQPEFDLIPFKQRLLVFF